MKASEDFFQKTGRRLDELGPDEDPERILRSVMGNPPLRRRTCANRPPGGDCRRWALPDSMFCREGCREAWRTRLDAKWRGGSIVREIKLNAAQVGATRFPRENSRKGDGLE